MECVEVPASLASLAPASDSLLIDWLRERVTPGMIKEIAQNDRAEGAAAHRRGIEALLRREAEPCVPAWHPREVLELERWEQPVDARGHLKRLFACTLLLRSAAAAGTSERGSDDEFFIETSAVTALRLTLSALALGGEAHKLALGFLLWCLEKQPYPSFRPFVAFCVQILAARLAAPRVSDDELRQIQIWVGIEEMRARDAMGGTASSERWLVGLNYFEDAPERRGEWAAAVFATSDQTSNT